MSGDHTRRRQDTRQPLFAGNGPRDRQTSRPQHQQQQHVRTAASLRPNRSVSDPGGQSQPQRPHHSPARPRHPHQHQQLTGRRRCRQVVRRLARGRQNELTRVRGGTGADPTEYCVRVNRQLLPADVTARFLPSVCTTVISYFDRRMANTIHSASATISANPSRASGRQEGATVRRPVPPPQANTSIDRANALARTRGAMAFVAPSPMMTRKFDAERRTSIASEQRASHRYLCKVQNAGRLALHTSHYTRLEATALRIKKKSRATIPQAQCATTS